MPVCPASLLATIVLKQLRPHFDFSKAPLGEGGASPETMLIRKEVRPVVVMFGSDNGTDPIDLGPYEGVAEADGRESG